MQYAVHVLTGVALLGLFLFVYRALGRLEAKLVARHANPLLIDAVREIKEIAGIVVRNNEQTIVRPAKDPAQPGTWTDAIAREVKSQTVADVNALTQASQARMKEAGQTPEQIAALVPQLVEAAVLEIHTKPTNGAH